MFWENREGYFARESTTTSGLSMTYDRCGLLYDLQLRLGVLYIVGGLVLVIRQKLPQKRSINLTEPALSPTTQDR